MHGYDQDDQEEAFWFQNHPPVGFASAGNWSINSEIRFFAFFSPKKCPHATRRCNGPIFE